MRLLAGARWRIGPADLMAFRDWSSVSGAAPRARRGRSGAAGEERRAARRRRHRGRPHRRGQPRRSTGLAAARGLDVGARPHADRRRPGTAAAALGRNSGSSAAIWGMTSPRLLGEVERAMLLDIEVAARPGFSIHQARRNLDAFQDAAAGFLQTSHRVDVLAFLAWLEAAAAEENGLDVAAAGRQPRGRPAADRARLQGPGMGRGVRSGPQCGAFPSSRDSRWSSGSAALPWPLRGDRADLPQWDLDQPDQKGWLDAEKDFKAAVQAHGEAEERRLAYVAYTRAKHVLWVSSAAWVGARGGMAEMSPFLAELEPLAGTERPRAHSRPASPQRDPPWLCGRGITAGGEPPDPGTRTRPLAVRPARRTVDPRTGAAAPAGPGRRAAMDSAAAGCGPKSRASRSGSLTGSRSGPDPADRPGTPLRRSCRRLGTGGRPAAGAPLPAGAKPGCPPARAHLRVHPGGPGGGPGGCAAAPPAARPARTGDVRAQGHGLPCLGRGVLRHGRHAGPGRGARLGRPH